MAMAAYSGKKNPAAPRVVVGRYELREKLGEGGMGVVWRAFDTKTGGDVAIKIMKDISDPAALELFTKEWRALAEMSHPNIVDVRDVDVLVEDNEKKPFFVMPLLQGSTLSELIKDSSERLTVTRIVEIMSQVCRGLQAAHQKGLIHRDLKPSNIFVMEDDTAKVIDFGVVYLAGSHSVTGQKGTFQYMSPEQVQMKEVTPASDIFSLGVILYESLTGRKPFACITAADTMQAVQKRIPPSVSELKPSIPHPVSQVVHKCLAKQAMHRFSTARELSETLQKASRNELIFDTSKVSLRIERAKAAFKAGDELFASELLSELESEGHLDPEITVLRMQIDIATKQKKIRQLLESARARIEQDEIALGLDKLREVLELDPENAEALALKAETEKKRSEAQAGKWVELGTTHLGNCDFVAARHAAQEALASRPGDTRALGLLNRIDVMEVEAKRVREQKEQLYSTAMKAYQNGEIDTAMSRMVRLFSVVRSKPEGAVPERDAVYESFYKEVRSEYDSIRSLLEEAQHEFGEENFTKALEICGKHLAKYPHDGTFQALKIQIEDAERQKVSAYIADVSRKVDAEPDLDRRANILREACERYPNEAQFAQQLKVVRERRDLVNSIVAKARQFEEKGQYDEELDQWDILRNIYPRYPGLTFELEECRKKRDQKAREEEKADRVEEIVNLMETRDFTKALERSKLALVDFPGDAELLGLEKLTKEGLERTLESNRLFELGQQEASAGDWTKATASLQEARRLDTRNTAVKDVLITVLVEHARQLLDSNWSEADRLHKEASALDPSHRAVRTLGIEVTEARRQTYVGERLTQARALMAAGNSAGAFECISEARKEYPKDTRLEQFQAILIKENKELEWRQERARRLEELSAERRRVEQEPDSGKARNLLKKARDLGAQDPDDPQTMQGIAEAELTVKRVLKRDDLTDVLRAESAVSLGGAAVDDDATKVFPTKPVKPPTGQRLSAVATSWMAAALAPLKAMSAKTRGIVFGAAGAILLLIVVGVVVVRHPPPQPPSPPPPKVADIKVHISAEPANSSLMVDGVPGTSGDITVPAGKTVTLAISHLGYKTKTIQLDSKAAPNLPVVLEAQPVRVTVVTGGKTGFVELDGNKAGDIVDGEIDGLDIPTDGNSHTLKISSDGHPLANLKFQANAGERPRLDPVGDKGILVVAGLGPAFTVYGGERLKKVAFGDTPVSLSSAGTDLPPVTDQQNELKYTDESDAGSLTLAPTEMPSLMLRALGAASEMVITSNVNIAVATLTANGVVVKPTRGSWRISKPAKYDLVLSSNNYETQSWTQELKPRQTLPVHITLALKAITPTLSTLKIAGGTPNAQILLDGNHIGDLDGNGAATFPGKLAAGVHKIAFQKEGFCTSNNADVPARPPADATFSGGKLIPCGSIAVQPSSQSASIKAQRIGDPANPTELHLGRTIQIQVGTYDITVNSPGNKPYEKQIQVEQGKTTDFAVVFTAARRCELASSGHTRDGDWIKPKDGSTPVLFTGCTNLNLVFAKPKANIIGKRKVSWDLNTQGGAGQAGRIQYDLDLDPDKIKRQAFAGTSKSIDVKETNVGQLTKDDTGSFSIRIHIDGSNIKVTNQNGEVLDDYAPQNPVLHDLTNGVLGIKTNGEFKFTSGGGS